MPCEGEWQVLLIETTFHEAEVSHKLGTLHKSTLPSVCRHIASRSRKEKRKVVVWSTRDIDEITQCRQLTMAERAWWSTSLLQSGWPHAEILFRFYRHQHRRLFACASRDGHGPQLLVRLKRFFPFQPWRQCYDNHGLPRRCQRMQKIQRLGLANVPEH